MCFKSQWSKHEYRSSTWHATRRNFPLDVVRRYLQAVKTEDIQQLQGVCGLLDMVDPAGATNDSSTTDRNLSPVVTALGSQNPNRFDVSTQCRNEAVLDALSRVIKGKIVHIEDIPNVVHDVRSALFAVDGTGSLLRTARTRINKSIAETALSVRRVADLTDPTDLASRLRAACAYDTVLQNRNSGTIFDKSYQDVMAKRYGR